MSESEELQDTDSEVYDEEEDSDEDFFEAPKSKTNLLEQLEKESSEEQEVATSVDLDLEEESPISSHPRDEQEPIKSSGISLEKSEASEESASSQENSKPSYDIAQQKSEGISLEKTAEETAISSISLEKKEEATQSTISLEKAPEEASRETPTGTISLEKEEPQDSVDVDSSCEKESGISLEKKEELSETSAKNPRLSGIKGDRNLDQKQSSLREQLRSQNINKKDFVKINLDALSAIAVADIKRSSMSSSAIVDVEVAKAKNLHPVKSGPPSPMCLLAIRRETNRDHEKRIEIKKAHEATSVLPKNSSPAWNEKKELLLDQVTGESQRFLVVEIRDKGPKGEFLGYVEINMNNIADLVQREEWFTLQKRKKKDKVSGEILLRTRIRPERKVEPVIAIKGEQFPAIPSFVYNSFWNQHCVRQLAITNCGIGSIPEGLCAMGSLEVLQLSDNNIVTVPKTLGRIFTLKFLDLNNNRISKLPGELSNLKNLQVFEIQGNKFSEDVVPPCVVDLDLWCDIIGKPEKWDELIEEELIKRESADQESVQDKLVMDEKEKEIQRLLQNMK